MACVHCDAEGSTCSIHNSDLHFQFYAAFFYFSLTLLITSSRELQQFSPLLLQVRHGSHANTEVILFRKAFVLILLHSFSNSLVFYATDKNAFSFSWFCYLQSFWTRPIMSLYHRDMQTLVMHIGFSLRWVRCREAIPGKSGLHLCHFITFCECACVGQSGCAWKGYIKAKGAGIFFPLRMLNKAFCSCVLTANCHMRSDRKFSTCGIMLVFKTFQNLKHF